MSKMERNYQFVVAIKQVTLNGVELSQGKWVKNDRWNLKVRWANQKAWKGGRGRMLDKCRKCRKHFCERFACKCFDEYETSLTKNIMRNLIVNLISEQVVIKSSYFKGITR